MFGTTCIFVGYVEKNEADKEYKGRRTIKKQPQERGDRKTQRHKNIPIERESLPTIDRRNQKERKKVQPVFFLLCHF